MFSKRNGGHRDKFLEVSKGPQSTGQRGQGDPAKEFIVRFVNMAFTPSLHSKHHHEACAFLEDGFHWRWNGGQPTGCGCRLVGGNVMLMLMFILMLMLMLMFEIWRKWKWRLHAH